VLLEDMGAVMKDTFNGKYDEIFRKTYIRATSKYVVADASAWATYVAMEKNKQPDILCYMAARFVAMAAKAALDATESADIRMGRYFPNKAWMAAVNVSPGQHAVKVTYYGPNGKKLYSSVQNVNVREGLPNLVETFCLK
jgi:hypothetical protein